MVFELFGCHIRRSPESGADHRHRSGVNEPSNAEVSESSITIGIDQYVGRLDVAMDDTSFVYVGKAACERRANRGSLARCQRSSTQGFGEALTLDIFHDQIRHVTFGARVQQPDERGVLETTEGLSLLRESSRVLRIRGADNFYGNNVTIPFVNRAINVRHSTSSKEDAQTVFSVQEFI